MACTWLPAITRAADASARASARSRARPPTVAPHASSSASNALPSRARHAGVPVSTRPSRRRATRNACTASSSLRDSSPSTASCASIVGAAAAAAAAHLSGDVNACASAPPGPQAGHGGTLGAASGAWQAAATTPAHRRAAARDTECRAVCVLRAGREEAGVEGRRIMRGVDACVMCVKRGKEVRLFTTPTPRRSSAGPTFGCGG